MNWLPLFALVISTSLFAQVATPAQPLPGRTSGNPIPLPTSMAHIGPEMSTMLSQLERITQQTTMDLGKLSIRKWKTASNYKEQAQHDVNSVQANVTGTLPGLIAQVRAAPDNTATLFKLYRNVDALLDVVRGLGESAGAFGPKSEYEDLQNDIQNLSSVRGNLASQIEAVASAKETEFRQMRAQLAQAQANTNTAVPKKIIIDDNEPPKHTVKKKKAPVKKTTPPENPKQ